MFNVLIQKKMKRLMVVTMTVCHALKKSLYTMLMVQNVRNKQQATKEQDSSHKYREDSAEGQKGCGNGTHSLMRRDGSRNQTSQVIFI